MRVPRVYCSFPLAGQVESALDTRACHYVTQVLRLGAGADLVLFDGSGHEFPATLVKTTRHECCVRIGARSEPEPAPPLRIRLGVGISRGERMDLVIQKSVELGVDSITPLFTARSVVKLQGQRLEKRQQHWRGIAVSACEQSGRRYLAEIHGAMPFDAWIRQQSGGILLDPAADQPLSALEYPGTPVNLLTGPEGGIAEDEYRLTVQQGFIPASLGPRILRAETAPLAALAVMQARWGDY